MHVVDSSCLGEDGIISRHGNISLLAVEFLYCIKVFQILDIFCSCNFLLPRRGSEIEHAGRKLLGSA